MESKSSLWDEEYQRQNIASSFKGTLSHSVKFLLGSFGEFSPKSFLDLGCGNGRNTIPLARMGYEVTGVDISQVALNQAGEKLESESAGVQKRVQLIPSSMGQPFPFEDKTFDVVMDITSFDILINDTEIDCHKIILQSIGADISLLEKTLAEFQKRDKQEIASGNIRTLPGVREFLNYLVSTNQFRGIITGNTKITGEQILQRTNLIQYFHPI